MRLTDLHRPQSHNKTIEYLTSDESQYAGGDESDLVAFEVAKADEREDDEGGAVGEEANNEHGLNGIILRRVVYASVSIYSEAQQVDLEAHCYVHESQKLKIWHCLFGCWSLILVCFEFFCFLRSVLVNSVSKNTRYVFCFCAPPTSASL